jgi:hypothetical protein
MHFSGGYNSQHLNPEQPAQASMNDHDVQYPYNNAGQRTSPVSNSQYPQYYYNSAGQPPASPVNNRYNQPAYGNAVQPVPAGHQSWDPRHSQYQVPVSPVSRP